MNKNNSGLGAIILAIIAIVFVGALVKGIPLLIKGVFWLFGIALVLLVVIIIAVVVLGFKSSSKKEKTEPSDNTSGASKKKEDEAVKSGRLTAEQESVLTKGRANILELRKIIVKIKDPEIHEKSNEICDVNEKILKTLREKPEQIQQVRQFLNYYLPTLGEILTKYQRIEASGVPATVSEKKVERYLDDIKKAMDKLYESLFENDKLDLSVEMEAMTLSAKREGLIDGKEKFELKDGDHDITLTI